MANVKLLDWVMNHIEANQELWNQSFWFTLNANGFTGDQLKQMVLDDPNDPACGSAKCFAGWACTKEGWLPRFTIHSGGAISLVGDVEKDGKVAYCETKASELLDIDVDTCYVLFNASNDLDDLKGMVAHIKEHGDLRDYDGCDNCDGTGQVVAECYACGNHDATIDCDNCGGTGRVTFL